MPVCAVNDDVDTTGATSTSFCGTPANYNITGPSTAGCITATPNGMVKDTAKVCIQTCKNGRCDTTYIFIPPPFKVAPKPDVFILPLTGGTTTSIILNDTTNGKPSSIGLNGNSSISQKDVWPAGIALDSLTGLVTVVANLTPGTYKLPYTLCDTFTPKNCAIDTVTITIMPLVDPNPDTYTLTFKGGTTITSITLNDFTNGFSTTIGVGGNSTISTVDPWPIGITLDPATGLITVQKGTAPGEYKLQYTLCDNLVPKNCIDETIILTVNPDIDPNPDSAIFSYRGGTMASIVLNDTTNGIQSTVGPLGNSTVSIDGTWPSGFTLNPTTGQVSVALGTKPGVYTLYYNLCDKLTPVSCLKETITITVLPGNNEVNPDINVTYVNVIVFGDVSTNDIIVPGTVYGSPQPVAGNPSPALPIISPNGTYSFIADVPGVYRFEVPACPLGVKDSCPTGLLTITVLDKNSNTNKPVVNVDIATTKQNLPVTLPTLANDRSGNKTTVLVISSVTIIAPPRNGKATVNLSTGDITYTPNSGFAGKDTLTYSVCDNEGNCGSAYQIITVLPLSGVNITTATDDYATVKTLRPIKGNVLINDLDPEGNKQTVVPQSLTIPGKGTFVLLSDGSYTFTLIPYYNGPINFPYTVCDDGVPVACASATLYITSIIEKEEVPNFITPNGDGSNDFFEIDEVMREYPNAKVMIYNRWGNIVWRSSGSYGTTASGVNLWRGQEQNSENMVPDGVYYYVIELEDYFKTTKVGFVQVMRR